MIAHLITLSNALAALSSALAAYFWYQASQVQAPPKILMGGSSWYHPVRIPTQSGQGFRFDVGHHSDLIPATIPK
jgi:hypothetical protein